MILDIILIAIFLITAYVGYRKGIIEMLANFFGSFAAILISYFFHAPFKELLVKFTGLDEFVFEKVVEKLREFGAHAAKSSVSSSDIDAVSKMEMPDIIKDKLTNYLTESTSNISKSAALSLTDYIVSIISVFILFVSILILIRIITKTLNLISKAPVISTVNKVGGILFSVLSTYLILTIAFMLFSSFASVDIATTSRNMIQHSVIAKLLIEFNPLFLMLANLSF